MKIDNKKIDMSQSTFSLSMWKKLHEVGTNMIFGDEFMGRTTNITWLLTPQGVDPNPGLKKRMVTGGVYVWKDAETTKNLVSDLIYLQYGLGIDGYSYMTCKVEGDDHEGKKHFTYVDKFGTIYEEEDGEQFSKKGFRSEMGYSGENYETFFRHTQPHKDVYYVRNQWAFMVIKKMQEVFLRIDDENYCENDHFYLSTMIDALKHMGVSEKSIELILCKVSGYLEDHIEGECLAKIIDYINAAQF